MSNNKLTRRTFMAASAGATLAGWSLSRSRAWGANDRIGIGVIGCGGRGNSLMGEVENLSQSHNVEVVAVCDVWKPNLAEAIERVKDKTGREPFSCSRFPDLLARTEVDAVLIATPDHAHSPILAAAARAKKHAYCEKPMAARMEDAVDALDAVKENGVTVQIGTQFRSVGKHKATARLIKSGVLGTISEIDTTYHRNEGSWARDYSDVRKEDVDWEQYLMGQTDREFEPRRFRCWHLFRDYTSGLPGLLGSHVIDLGVWFADDPLPKNGAALGGVYVWKDGREHCDTIECLWEFPKGFLLRYSTRLGNNWPTPQVTVYGTNGTFDTTTGKASPEGGEGENKLSQEIAVEAEPDENHMANLIECIRSGKTPNASIDAGYAHSVITILGSEAQRLGTRLVYDSEKREILAG
jgi:predicted dehydrogenase